MQRSKINDLIKTQKIAKGIVVKGWVRSCRGSKNVSFIALNDGSTINNVQIVAEAIHFDEKLLKQITTGSCIEVVGNVVQSKGSGQKIEIKAKKITILGHADADEYPLQPKKHS